jgi:hypothetical protein
MSRIDALAELWDRRKVLCLCTGAILLAAWVGAHRWLPAGFGPEVFQAPSSIPIVGSVAWNARLRFIVREKEQYLGAVPDDADAGDLYGPQHVYHTSFIDGHASLGFRVHESHQDVVDAGNSPILAQAGPQKDRLASGAEDGSIVIWQVQPTRSAFDILKPLVTLHTGNPVTALAFRYDATILASGSSDGKIRIWNLSGTPRLLREIQDQERTVYALEFSEDGSELSSGGFDGVLRVRKWESDESAIEEERHSGPIYELGWAASARWDCGYYGLVRRTRPDRRTRPEISSPYEFLPTYHVMSLPTYPGDWVGELTFPVRLSLSPNRRLLAMVAGGGLRRYLSVWEQGRSSFPFGLRYRVPVPENYPREEIRWSQDSTALCFRSMKDSSCQWLDAATGCPTSPMANPVIARSAPLRGTIYPVIERVERDRTMLDHLTGRKIIAKKTFDEPMMIDVGYVSRRFPLVPIELLVLPALAGAFAFTLRRSPYWNRKRSFAPVSATLRAFFAAAGAETSEQRLGVLRVSRLDSPLTPYAPMPAVIAIGQADESHIELLVETMKNLHGENHRAAGFLFYQEPPNAVALLRMAEARMNQLAVIPIPLAAVERMKQSATEARALLNEYAERYLPGRNLFDDRNAIGDAVAFFGRGRLLAKLEQELLNHQSLGLWGLRKAGKTSILLQLEQIFRNRPVVRIGLEPFTVQAPFGNRIFNEILRLGKEASFPVFPVDRPARDSTVEFLAAVQGLAARLGEAGVPLPIVCMLDEMERVLPKDAASAEEFNVTFGALRNLCQDKRVMSLLVTDLFADSNQVNQWPVAGAGTNPLFNFLKSVYAGPFEEADTVQMIDTLGKLMNFQLDPVQLAAIHELSGGHAFLARQVAAMLYDRREDGAGREKLLANPIRFSETLRSYFPENVWSPLETRGDTAALTILSVLADGNRWMTDTELQARCGQPKTVFWSAIEWLTQTGVIASRPHEGEGESYRIRMGMFAQWFQQSEVSVPKNA